MKQKKIKGAAAGLILLLMLAAGIRHAHFQSVDSYQREQLELAEGLDIGSVSPVPSGMWVGETAQSPFAEDGNAADGKGPQETDGDGKEKNAGEERQAARNAARQGAGKASGTDGMSTHGRNTSSGNEQSSGGGSGKNQAGGGDGKSQAEKNSSGIGGSDSHESFSGGNQNVAVSSKPAQDADNEAAAVQTAPPQKEKTPQPGAEKITCTIAISCSSLLENKSSVEENLWKYIPEDGNILPETSVTVDKGSSVYDVLAKVCKAKDIALDAEYTPLYKSYYLKGIGHLYEKQAGDRSGWVYEVNGVSPGKGASGCKAAQGDVICWKYTCDGKTT